MSDLSANISPKYRISIGTNTIFPNQSRLAKNSVKLSIFMSNIESTWHAHVGGIIAKKSAIYRRFFGDFFKKSAV